MNPHSRDSLLADTKHDQRWPERSRFAELILAKTPANALIVLLHRAAPPTRKGNFTIGVISAKDANGILLLACLKVLIFNREAFYHSSFNLDRCLPGHRMDTLLSGDLIQFGGLINLTLARNYEYFRGTVPSNCSTLQIKAFNELTSYMKSLYTLYTIQWRVYTCRAL